MNAVVSEFYLQWCERNPSSNKHLSCLISVVYTVVLALLLLNQLNPGRISNYKAW